MLTISLNPVWSYDCYDLAILSKPHNILLNLGPNFTEVVIADTLLEKLTKFGKNKCLKFQILVI